MVPEIIGRYRVLDQLEENSLGALYLGVDPILGRKVTIQTVRLDLPSLAEEEFAERFNKELTAAQRLSHANIATVYDSGRDGSLAYLATELLEGRDLRQLIVKDKPVPAELVVELVSGVADALAYAHRHGVIHKGVSPENIAVLANGKVKLSGFGLAALKSGMPPTSPMLGTPAYMAPEQFSGKVVDARTDVFSLGIVLYQLLTGRAPFAADTAAEVMYRIVRKPAREPSRVVHLGHRGFDVILAKALAKSPENRYQTANEFAADLRRARDLAAEKPLPWPAGGLVPRKSRSRSADGRAAHGGLESSRRWLPYAAAAGLLLAGIGFYSFVPSRTPQAQQAMQVAEKPPAQVAQAAISEPPVEPSGVPQTQAKSEPASSPAPLAPASPEPAVPPPAAAALESPKVDNAIMPQAQTAATLSEVQLATITLAVAPWGEVFVDNKRKGISPPLIRLQLPPGKVRIEIRNSGAPSFTKELTLGEGKTVHIKHKF